MYKVYSILDKNEKSIGNIYTSSICTDTYLFCNSQDIKIRERDFKEGELDLVEKCIEYEKELNLLKWDLENYNTRFEKTRQEMYKSNVEYEKKLNSLKRDLEKTEKNIEKSVSIRKSLLDKLNSL